MDTVYRRSNMERLQELGAALQEASGGRGTEQYQAVLESIARLTELELARESARQEEKPADPQNTADLIGAYRTLREQTALYLRKYTSSGDRGVQQQILMEDCAQLAEEGYDAVGREFGWEEKHVWEDHAQNLREEEKRHLPERLQTLSDEAAENQSGRGVNREYSALTEALQTVTQYEQYLNELQDTQNAPGEAERQKLQDAYRELEAAANAYLGSRRADPTKLELARRSRELAQMGLEVNGRNPEELRERMESELFPDSGKPEIPLEQLSGDLVNRMGGHKRTLFGRQRRNSDEYAAVQEALERVNRGERRLQDLRERGEEVPPMLESALIRTYKQLESAADFYAKNRDPNTKAGKERFALVQECAGLASKGLRKLGRDEQRPFREDQKRKEAEQKNHMRERSAEISDLLNSSKRMGRSGPKKNSPLYENMRLAAQKVAELEKRQETLISLGKVPSFQSRKDLQAAYLKLEKASQTYLSRRSPRTEEGRYREELAAQCRQLAKHGVERNGRTPRALSAIMVVEERQRAELEKQQPQKEPEKERKQPEKEPEKERKQPEKESEKERKQPEKEPEKERKQPEKEPEKERKQPEKEPEQNDRNRENIKALDESIGGMKKAMETMPESGLRNLMGLCVEAQTRMKENMERGRVPYPGMKEDLKVMVVEKMMEDDQHKPEGQRAFNETTRKIMAGGDPAKMQAQMKKMKMGAFDEAMGYMWTQGSNGKPEYNELVVNVLVGEKGSGQLAQICASERVAHNQQKQMQAQLQASRNSIPVQDVRK